MRTRSFETSDTEAVVALWERSGLTRPWNDPRRDIERKTRVQPELFLVGVADDDARVIASAMGGYDGHRGWIYYLAVDPDERAHGLGRRLVAELERMMAELGCPKVTLMVRDGNEPALAFWTRLGYAPDAATTLGKRLVED